jgi:molybdate transport system substrate-binding protein
VVVQLLFGSRADAAEVSVAVAANFAAPMTALAADFGKDTGHRALMSVGATGKLFAQIQNGAPYEVFLSADEKTPRKLEAEGLAVSGAHFTYALGRLVLWSARERYVDDRGAVLQKGTYEHLAIANPQLAPYGAAAIEVLTRLGVLDALRSKLVRGENVAQTQEFIATGNAALGFVALSQIRSPGKLTRGSYWLVPAELYSPIRQDAALLMKGAQNPAARALFEYLRTAKARSAIAAYGYGLPSAESTPPSPTAPAQSAPPTSPSPPAAAPTARGPQTAARPATR